MRAPQLIVVIALLVSATPTEAQYRRQVREQVPAYAVVATVGALLPYEETITPIETPLPDENRRGRRNVDTAPWLSLSARYGRGLAVYASVAAALPGDAELTGADPETGAPLTGTVDVGLISIVSAGMSFTPLRSASGLRLEVGPAWVDLGDGGSYLAVRLAATASFLDIGDRGAVLLGWDGYFAGGQYDRDGTEYQVRGGILNGLRAGFSYAW